MQDGEAAWLTGALDYEQQAELTINAQLTSYRPVHGRLARNTRYSQTRTSADRRDQDMRVPAHRSPGSARHRVATLAAN
jgi:hypothetical protein